jgi:hypothetical protein
MPVIVRAPGNDRRGRRAAPLPRPNEPPPAPAPYQVTTPNLGLIKPQVAGDPDIWGEYLNANFDVIDSGLLPIAGGTVTGNLEVDGTLAVGNGNPITTAGTVLAGHLACGRAGDANGGFVGSWNVVNGGYTGFWTDAAGVLNFGSADPALGTITGTRGVLDGGGNLWTAGGITAVGSAAINGAAGTERQILIQSSGSLRWKLYAGSGAESGSSAGSNFALARFGDGGNLIDAPIAVSRSSGLVTLADGLQVTAGGVAVGNSGTISTAGQLLAGFGTFGWAGGGLGGFVGSWDPTTGAIQGLWSANNFLAFGLANSAGNPSTWYGGFDNTGGFSIASANASKPGGGAWNASSDARIKTVHGEYTQGLEAVCALVPVVYSYKGNASLVPAAPPIAGSNLVGLIAQDVETIFPEMVSRVDGVIDGVAVTDLRQLDTTALIFALCNAVRELRDRIETLEGAHA